MRKVCVLGGDMRQFYLTKALAEHGCSVATFGVPQLPDTHGSLEDALAGAEILLLPVPLYKNGNIQIFTVPEVDEASITRFVGKNCSIFVGGKINFPSFDYLQDERFLQDNAEITAEGAVSLIMENTGCTVSGSRILIVGFGRIGKALAKKLALLGCEVFVSARSEKDISQIIACGYRAVITRQYRDLEQFDCIVNTVPAAVFSAEQAAQIACPLIELASAPGGLPANAETPAQYVLARGLPGKYAPKSAAQAMLAFILRKLAF